MAEGQQNVQQQYASLPKDEYDAKGFLGQMQGILELAIERFESDSPGQDPVAVNMKFQALEGVIITCGKDGIPEIHAGLPTGSGETPRYKMGVRVEAYTRSGGKAYRSVDLKGGASSIETFDMIKPLIEVTTEAINAAKVEGRKKQRKQELGEAKHYPWSHQAGAEGDFYAQMEKDITKDPLDKKIALVSEMRRAAEEKLGDSLSAMDSQYVELKELNIVAGISKDETGKVYKTGAVGKDIFSRMAILVKTKEGYEGFASVGCANAGEESMARKSLDGKTVSEPFEVARSLGEDAAFTAKALENAEDITFGGGKIPVIMGGNPAAVWTHEGRGHPMEADIISDNSENSKAEMKLKTTIGSPVGPKNFNVVEDARPRGGRSVGDWGSIGIDDEGTRPYEVKLIENGVLKRVMTSREYVKKMAAPPTSEEIGKGIEEGGPTPNKRSEDFSVEPLIRMTTTRTIPDQNGPKSIGDMAAMIPRNKKGIYMLTSNGGQVDPDGGMFMVNGQLCYLIENGTVTPKVVRNVVVKDNLKNVPESIKAIGSEETAGKFTGMCGKDGQWVRVLGESPAIYMEVELAAGGGWGKKWSEKQDEQIKQTRKDLREGTLSEAKTFFDTEWIGSKTLFGLITEPAKKPDYVFDGKELVKLREEECL